MEIVEDFLEALQSTIEEIEEDFQNAEDDIYDCEHIITESVTPKISHAQNNFDAFYSKINEFFIDEKYTDVRIKCQDQIFNCHRVILAAASKYFDTMFYGGLGHFVENHLKEICLHDVDIVAFQEVLRFAYKGVVSITDDNVYNLLRASEMLELTFVENECIRYMAAYGVPPNYALDLFSFSHSLQKDSLIPIVGRYIMKNLDRYSRHRDFLRFSFEELKTLLIYWEASSAEEEQSLLSALARWASNLTSISPQRRTFGLSNFTEYINFRYLSVKYVADYCLKFISNYGEFSDNDSLFTSDSNINVEFGKSSLHVYVNFLDKIVDDSGDLVLAGENFISQTNVFTFQGCAQNMNSYPSHNLTFHPREMRSVALGDQLYCLKPRKGKRDDFFVCSSVDLSDARPLKQPLLDKSGYFPAICAYQNYICGPYSYDSPQQLLMYYRDLDLWAPILAESVTSCPSMTCDGDRMFAIGGIVGDKSFRYPHSINCTRDVEAYDHRAGNWTELPKSILRHSAADESCSHEGKIYVSCAETVDKSDLLDVYDSRAAKWELIKMKHSLQQGCEFRLTSYDKRLWVVGIQERSNKNKNDRFQVQIYDSFLQEWTISDTLDHVVQDKIYQTCKNRRGNTFIQILDVVRF